MARKKRHSEHTNHERWLVSYADFITLLFAFFVVMYSIAMQDKNKAKAIIEAIAASFRTAGQMGAAPHGAAAKLPEDAELKRLGDAIIQQLGAGYAPAAQPAGHADQQMQPEKVEVLFEDRGLVVRLSATDFFAPGRADARPDALPLLDKIASSLKGTEHQIRVEGHTDNIAVESEDFASNWELSTSRATWVVRYLVKKFDLNPAKLSASGYAEFRPIAPNDTEQGRARNRRVEIIVLSRDPLAP